MGKNSSAKPVKGAGWLLNITSFVAVICIGVALILSRFNFLASVSSALMIIAQTIAYLVVSAVSFFYVYRKRRIWIWAVWIVSIVLIILFYIFSL